MPAGNHPQKTRGRAGAKDNLIYPADVHTAPFICQLSFTGYNRPISYAAAENVPRAVITLPLPSQISEALNIQHDTSSKLGVITNFLRAADLATNETSGDLLANSDAMKLLGAKGASVIGSELVKVATSKISKSAGAGAGLVGKIGQAIEKGVGNISELAPNVIGAMFNPHLTALFSGVNLRSFSYSWQFSPRNEDESLKLRNIIRRIQRASLPTTSPGQITLTYPEEVQIDFLGANMGFHLFGTKRTVIENVNVDYTPEGHPMFYKTGAPVSLGFSIQLKEVAIRTAEDFDDSTNNASANRGS